MANISKKEFSYASMKDGLEILIDYNEDKNSDLGNHQEATIFIETLGIQYLFDCFGLFKLDFDSTC